MNFASMDPTKQKAIASKGGRAAHRLGTAHEWTPEQAQVAGRLGGLKAAGARKSPEWRAAQSARMKAYWATRRGVTAGAR